MRILIAALLLAVPVFAQGPAAPVQGPPPKNLSKQPDGHISANTVPSNSENFEVHVVQQGETLSGIAGGALKDIKLWPQLWESNEHIVNPHWIYPNDKVLVRPQTRIADAAPPTPAVPAAAEPAPPVVDAAPLPPVQAPVPASVGIAVLTPRLVVPVSALTKPKDNFVLPAPRAVPAIKATDMNCSGFVRSMPITDAIKVASTHQRDAAALSNDGQYIHISKGSKGGVTVGALYQVVRPTRKIYDLTKKRASDSLGMHYLDVGQIQVTQVQEDSAMARVVGNCEAVEVGDVIIPFVRPELPELPRNRSFSSTMTAQGKLKGALVFMKIIVAATGSTYRTSSGFSNEGTFSSEGGIVYINLGKADGVKSGDLFIVYNEEFAIGEIAVLKVEDKASSALVTYSTDGMPLGARVEQR